ncbi:hypothetical protein HYV31_02775 [candidate division WWE3 bacterium]|nr:hypothetical protein [candidate division WWE3 bacterium]
MVSVSFAKLHKTIFYLILVLLPTNLGKHFISVDSYVNSRLVDYLVPTFWLIDILLFGLFITWAFSGGFKKIKRFEYKQVFLIFILAFFPSIILAP